MGCRSGKRGPQDPFSAEGGGSVTPLFELGKCPQCGVSHKGMNCAEYRRLLEEATERE